MSSSISWMGNRVVNTGSARPYPAVSAAAVQPAADVPAPSPSPIPAPTPTGPQSSTNSGVTQQGPPPSTEPGFIPYFLSTHIGRNVRAEFIVGTNQYVDKTGVLSEVGINYFVLHDVNSRTDIMCDLYSVKFVTLLTD